MTTTMKLNHCRVLAPVFAFVSAQGCGSEPTTEGTGSVTVLLEPDRTIIDGLEAGDAVGEVSDGWTVRFDKYIMGIGRIATHLGSDADVEADDDQAYVIDLTQLPSHGETLWELNDLVPGRWTFGYEFVAAAHGKRHGSVSKQDFERMQKDDLTHLIVGKLTKANGVSCPPKVSVVAPEGEPTDKNAAGDDCYPNSSIEFEFGVSAPTVIANCMQDGLPGFVVADGRTSNVAITVHGDHLLFNGFPESAEGGIMRLAQLWADTDLNLDGQISTAEHRDVLLADLAEWDDTYQKGGAPIERLETVGDLTVGQLKTQGHMDGEGECSPDGVPHDHD